MSVYKQLCIGLCIFSLITALAAEESKLKSQLKVGSTEIIFTDVTGNGRPDILETWWNGKRCRWFDEDENMKRTDKRGDMVNDAVQIDVDGDGFYDGPEDMNIKWTDNDGDGMADLMTVAINPSMDQARIRGFHSLYMHFVDVDKDGVNHYIDWKTFDLNAWQHTDGCNFSPDYNGNSIFLKVHLPPWALVDPRFNWENPFAFYDFDDDGCTEMAIRYLNNHKQLDDTMHTYKGFVETVQLAYDLDNNSQQGQEQSLDLTLAYYDGERIDYRNYIHKYPRLKAPEWALDYYKYPQHRKIDELVYTPHELCYEKTMQTTWGRGELAFDEDGDDHRWERVNLYKKGDPYAPRIDGVKNNSIVEGSNFIDTKGDRTEWDDDYSGEGKLYVGQWDNKIHLFGAETGVWLVDDGTYYCKANTCAASSLLVAPKVDEVIQYEDTDSDGFFDVITFDYNGDKIVDMHVDLKEYDILQPELIDPASEEWAGLHEQFKKMAKKSWQDAQLVYRAAWRAGLNNDEIDELAIASSTWEKYDHGYWLKAKLFRTLYKSFTEDAKKQEVLKRAYFTSDFETMAKLMSGK